MPDSGPEPRIEYLIDRPRRRVRVTFFGAVTADQVEGYMRELDGNPEYEADFDALIDLRCFVPTLSREDIQRIALLVRAHTDRPASRRAVLVSSEGTADVTRLFEGLTFLSPVIYRSFRSEAAAETWLAEHHGSHRGSIRKNAGQGG